MIFLGVDPGLEGAIALLPENGKNIRFFDTPVLTIKSGKKLRRQMDARALAFLLEQITDEYEGGVFAVIEKVTAMPSQRTEDGEERRTMGAASAFNFGKGAGIWVGLFAGMQIPYEEVHPATWKSKLMRDMGKGKDASRVKATQLFPETAKDLSRKKDHGRADALMLALYGYKNQGQFEPPRMAETLF